MSGKKIDINYIINNYKIFIDTSSLLGKGSLYFFDYISKILIKKNQCIYVPNFIIFQIKKILEKANEKSLYNIKVGSLILDNLLQNDLAKVINIKSEDHNDHAAIIRKIFSIEIRKNNFCLITRDINITKELSTVYKSLKNKVVNKLLVLSFDNKGNYYYLCNNDQLYIHKNSISVNNEIKIVDITNIIGKPLDVKIIPKINDIVKTSDGKSFKLCGELSRGGEGIIYETDLRKETTEYLAKIYLQDDTNKITLDQEAKIKQMINLKIKNHKQGKYTIAWPVDLVLNSEDKFVGFIMPKVEGKILQSTVFTPKVAENLGLSRSDLVKIAINFLEAAIYLHDKEILLGDINPMNILVNFHDKTIGLIDTDSYQIGPFNCKVGTIEFTRPELIKNNINFNNYSRKPIDEAFAVAVLIFRILMLGKHPYSYQGGDDILNNMKTGNFPYRLKEHITSTHEVPSGPWKYIWSHIFTSLREKLGEVLIDELEIVSKDNLIEYEKELIVLLTKYLKAIHSGIYSNELLPKYYYVPPHIEKVLVNCSKCGVAFEIAKGYYDELTSKSRQILCGIHLQAYILKNKYNKISSSNNKNSSSNFWDVLLSNSSQIFANLSAGSQTKTNTISNSKTTKIVKSSSNNNPSNNAIIGQSSGAVSNISTSNNSSNITNTSNTTHTGQKQDQPTFLESCLGCSCMLGCLFYLISLIFVIICFVIVFA